jgi:EAL domain-containing protein (putative c-di-GMP-specific phosphodiesterase class I)/AmiR/NasT family two-component response regulator
MEQPVTNRQPLLVALDDDAQIVEIVGDLAEQAGFAICATTDYEQFDEVVSSRDPDVIVLDLQMPTKDGIEVLRQLADRKVMSGIVLLSGVDERTLASSEQFATAAGLTVLWTMQKPFAPEELLERLLHARAAAGPLTVENLQHAIDSDQLLLYYQPTAKRFADGSWDIAAVEALLRWNHPERGILTPDHFLDMGERFGLMQSMTDYVIQKGVEQLRGWHAARLDLHLRINVAANLFTDLDFPDRFENLLLEQSIDPASITLEVTETSMLEQHKETFDILSRLRIKDVNLAIDDFGIGYSSLTQLFRMPFNEMKIDKSLVLQAAESKEARVMVDALVGLAHKLRMTVCAEGVETEDVLAFLDSVNCDSAQGYYIGHPVPADELPGVIERWAEVQPAGFGSKLRSADG